MQNAGEDQQCTDQCLQLIAQALLAAGYERGEEQVDEAEHGQIERIGVLQEAWALALQAGGKGQQQCAAACDQVNDLQHI